MGKSTIWVEIISIRTGGITEVRKVLKICMLMFPSIEVKNLINLRLYYNVKYATDISIHLQWKKDPGGKSDLGNEVDAALKGLGLISHTVWIEFTTEHILSAVV